MAVDVGRRFEHTGVPRARACGSGRAGAADREGDAGALDRARAASTARQAARAQADVLIEPETGTCAMLDFRRLDEMVEAGRRRRQALADDPVLRALRHAIALCLCNA